MKKKEDGSLSNKNFVAHKKSKEAPSFVTKPPLPKRPPRFGGGRGGGGGGDQEDDQEEEEEEALFAKLYIQWWFFLWRKKRKRYGSLERRDGRATQSPSLGGESEKEERIEEKESRRRRGEIEGAKRESVHILVLEEGAKRTTGGGGKAGEEVTRAGARPNDVGGAATVRGCRARPAVVREDDFSEEFN